ncbi:MAG: integrin [Pseudomonadota bacterium]
MKRLRLAIWFLLLIVPVQAALAGMTAQEAYIKASNTDEGDSFGRSVAVSGDTVIIGASLEDSNATGVNGSQGNAFFDSGAVYVLVPDTAGLWSQQAYIKASNTGGGDEFGWSVALSGDTLVVGARLEDSDATGVNGAQDNNAAEFAGAAYVFVRNGAGEWSQQAYLKASNTESEDQFGFSVAISGDTIVVGAPREDSDANTVNGDQGDNMATSSGAAYVFVRNAGIWTQQAYLKASNSDALDGFGQTLAIDGDTIVVGAPNESSAATGVNGDQLSNAESDSGAAYVFVRSGTNWTQQAYLKASNTGFQDNFGEAVAISGESILIGAPDEDSNATGVNGDDQLNGAFDSGAAYLFVRNGMNWSQQAYIKASNTGSDDLFGSAVSIDGDQAVIGARGEASNATGVDGEQNNNSMFLAGAAYLFDRSGVDWTQRAYLKASNTESLDQFGAAVGLSGPNVIIAARDERSSATGVDGDQADNSAISAGAAYLFFQSPVIFADGFEGS